MDQKQNLNLYDRFKRGFNVFKERELNNPDNTKRNEYTGDSNSRRQYTTAVSRTSERSVIAAIYNRLAMDVSSIEITHARVDDNHKLVSRMDSGLNDCINLSANIDQTGRAFIQDVAMSLFEEGVAVIVPVDTMTDIKNPTAVDILSMRVATVTAWHPKHVRLKLYDDRIGQFKEITLRKEEVAIIVNPFYAVMNEPNSTLKRLIRKLNILDAIDEQSGTGKLDIIIQLPYAIKSAAKMEQAKQRREDLEVQLKDSKFGVGYIDATEKLTQLNRPAENNLMNQIEYLTSMLYSQLGLTKSIFEGTASESETLNYHNGTIEPIVSAIVDSMIVAFLTKTARTQGQSIVYYRDPFKLTPVSTLAEIADKFTRNEIVSSNEFRAVIGLKPSDDPRADELRNKNLNEPGAEGMVEPQYEEEEVHEEQEQK